MTLVTVGNTVKDVTESTGRALLKCRACKAKGHRAFTMIHTSWAYDGRPYGSQAVEVDGRQQTVRDRYDLARALHTPCPACGSADVIVNVVKGTHVADKNCDARCMGATGPNCECSCGGENHGGRHSAW